MNSNVPKTLKLYSKYLKDILNDLESSREMLDRAKDLGNIKMNMNCMMSNDIFDENDMSTISSDGTPCIFVSGDLAKIGKIINCN